MLTLFILVGTPPGRHTFESFLPAFKDGQRHYSQLAPSRPDPPAPIWPSHKGIAPIFPSNHIHLASSRPDPYPSGLLLARSVPICPRDPNPSTQVCGRELHCSRNGTQAPYPSLAGQAEALTHAFVLCLVVRPAVQW